MTATAFQAVSSITLDTDQLRNTGTNENPDLAFAINPRFDSNIIIESGFDLEFHDPTDTFSTNIKAGAQAFNVTLTLPITLPSTGQALASIDGANGNLQWQYFMLASGVTVRGEIPFFANNSGISLEVNPNFKLDPDLFSLTFGDNNIITNGEREAILGGSDNTIDSVGGDNVIIGGSGNQLTSFTDGGIFAGRTNLVSGEQSVAIGGESNTVSGFASYAFGFKSLAGHDYSFVFSDHSDIATGLQTTAAGQFLVQSTGGFGFVSGNINLTSFPNNFINIYSDLVDIRAKLQYKNNAGLVSTTILDVLQVKGDLYTFNSTINDRLGVGTNGQILSANSATTTGLEWINNATGSVSSISAGSNIVCTPDPIISTGSVALSSTPSGLTSVGVGTLLLVGGTVRGSNGVLIESTASGQSIGLSPKGATQVRIFSQDASNAIPLRFYNSDNTQYVEFKAGTLAGNTTWTWPTADAAGVMVSDGSGNLSLTASPSLTTATLTGAALTEHDYTANSGASVTIDPANGHSQGITLDSATPTLTLASNPSSGNVKEMTVDIIQDGTGGRNPTWANVTWAAGSAPTINQTAGAVTYLTFKGTTRGWIGFAANSNILNYGAYTPTLTNTANLSASTAYPCQYMQVGTVVTVSGRVDVDPTTITTLTQLKISLPVSSNFTQSYQCGGCGGAAGTSVEAYGITAAPSDTNALMSWVAVDVTNHQVAFSFTYQVV